MIQDLAKFLPEGPATDRWLLIDSSKYLKQLRRQLPKARITAVTRFEEVPELQEFQDLSIEWHVLDYRLTELPFADAAFDHIVAAPCLEEAYEPYETMLAISRKLTPVGCLYTQFKNIRYGGMLAALQQGQFPIRQQHLYAKAEIVRLLNDALFKEIHFTPGEQDDDDHNETVWQQAGFDDFSRDLATRVWLVRAERSTAAVANLKGLYDEKIRQQLARLLHRIEYDIDCKKNLAELRKLCEINGIFPEYLDDFIQEACIHQEKVRRLL